MKTKMLIILFATLMIVSLLYASCAPAPATTAAPGQTTKTSGATTTAIASGAAVSIEGFAFNPQSLTIKAGTTVTWTNNDAAGHDVKSDLFASPKMAKGETFSFKYETAGTYEYICGIHPSMKGTIIVE